MSEVIVKQGSETTEYKETQNAKLWGTIATVLGLIMSLGSTVIEALGQDTRIGIIAGALVTVVGLSYKTLVQLGYIKSRTDIKTTAYSNSDVKGQNTGQNIGQK